MLEVQFSDGKTQAISFNEIESMTKQADSITGMTIDYENGLKDLKFLEDFPKLEELSITRCISVEDIKPIASLKKLKSLDLCSTGVVKIKDFLPINELKDLERLQLAGLQRVYDLKFLKGLVKIELLNLNFCYGLTDISTVEDMPKLTALHIKGCDKLNESLLKIKNLIEKQFKFFTPPKVEASS